VNAVRGGLITLTANTPVVVGCNVVQTSAIKLAGASVLSYAGVSPFLSLAGYWYGWGQAGVNPTASATPPSITIPNTAGSVYISGDAGTKIKNGLYVNTINNLYGQDLTIQTPVFSGSNASININSTSNIYLTATTGTGEIINMNGNTTNIQGNAGSLNLLGSNGGSINLNTNRHN
jgi:hypothetical protein